MEQIIEKGTNLIFLATSSEIGVALYTDGARAVVGSGVVLRWSTNIEGCVWTLAAKRAVRTLLNAVSAGGVAWEENGEVVAVVPRWTAWQVARVMREVEYATTQMEIEPQNDPNILRMLGEGVVDVVWEGGAFVFREAEWVGSAPALFVAPTRNAELEETSWLRLEE